MTAAVSACGPTYPAKTLQKQLTGLVKNELSINITTHISGKTLWIYLPLENLIDEKSLEWNEKELDLINEVINIAHRVLLSTDANLSFLAIAATDVKTYGLELTIIEYIPDIKQAVLEKFSRGEFFSRSLKDVSSNPNAVNDMTGASKRFYDITFNEFISLQVMHRAKMLFSKDQTLKKIFEIKSSSVKEKFGIFRIEIEFFRKTYDLTPEEEKIDPLDYVKMIVAEVVKNYDFKDFQIFEITDTFSQKTVKVTPEDIKKIEIKLPKYKE